MSDSAFSRVVRDIWERGDQVTVQTLLGTIEREAGSKETAPGRTIRSVAQLIEDVGELPPMLIEGFLPDRSLFLLAGKPKAGKSFLALDIADSVCQGTGALGMYQVNRPGPVVYLGMEDGEIEIVKRLRQRGLQPGDQRRLYYITDSFVLTEADNLAAFRAQVERMAPSLIVIDTAAEALGIRDWLNRSEIIDKVAPIRRLAREVCSVLLVAHNRKAEGDGGDEIAGSNAFAGAVDGWISAQRVERRDNGNRRMFLRIEGRGGVRGEIAVEMDTLTLGFSVVTQSRLEADTRDAKQGALSAIRQPGLTQMRQAIRDLGGGATISAIADHCGWGRTKAWTLMQELVAGGEAAETELRAAARGMGRPAPVFRIVDY